MRLDHSPVRALRYLSLRDSEITKKSKSRQNGNASASHQIVLIMILFCIFQFLICSVFTRADKLGVHATQSIQTIFAKKSAEAINSPKKICHLIRTLYSDTFLCSSPLCHMLTNNCKTRHVTCGSCRTFI